MKWTFLIPAVAIVALFIESPVEAAAAVAIVVAGCFGAMWLTDRMEGRGRRR